MKHFYISFLVIITAFSPTILSADKNLKNSPLDPGISFKWEGWLGIEVGAGPNIQSGDMKVPCDDCTFDNGRGTGYYVGLTYDHYFEKEFSAGFMLSYEEFSIASQYREIQLRTFSHKTTGDRLLIDVELQQRAELQYAFIGLTPHVRYRPIEEFSIRAGLMAAFGEPLLTHTETVASPVELIQGETYLIEKAGQSDLLVADAVPEGQSSTAFYGFVAATGHFWIRYDLSLLASVQWRQQFGSYDFYGSDFQLLVPRFSLGLEYMIYKKS
jgi:hypothetical protein